jgi:hypothetical protein
MSSLIEQAVLRLEQLRHRRVWIAKQGQQARELQVSAR